MSNLNKGTVPLAPGAIPVLGHALALARNPDVQHQLQDEVDRVLGGRAATRDDLDELRLTRNVVLEAMRLYPPAWFLTRRTTRPTHLDGYVIPQGTSVLVSTYLLHRRPDVYPEPARFDPDRWNNGELSKKSAMYLPFGVGPRICIGDVFGFKEVILIMATVASRWHLDPLTPEPGTQPVRGGSLRPQEITLRITARQPCHATTAAARTSTNRDCP